MKNRSFTHDQNYLTSKADDVSKCLRILVETSDDLCSSDDHDSLAIMGALGWNSFSDGHFVQQHIFPPYRSIRSVSRIPNLVPLAQLCCMRQLPPDPDLMWMPLGETQLEMHHLSEPESLQITTIIIVGAFALAKYQFPELIPAWRKILQQLLFLAYHQKTPSDHKAGLQLNTYLFMALEQKRVTWNMLNHETNEILHDWLEELARAGIDLAEYARALSDSTFYTSNNIPFWLRGAREWVQIRIIGIRTNARIEGWAISVSCPLDECVGDFWHLLENPEMYIPGAWIEDYIYSTHEILGWWIGGPYERPSGGCSSGVFHNVSPSNPDLLLGESMPQLTPGIYIEGVSPKNKPLYRSIRRHYRHYESLSPL